MPTHGAASATKVLTKIRVDANAEEILAGAAVLVRADQLVLRDRRPAARAQTFERWPM